MRSEISDILSVHTKNSYLLLGYELILTPSEHRILTFLCERSDWQPAGLIAELTGVSASSITVHVSHLNKKAKQISGRVLICGNRKNEYKLTENI